MVQTIASNSQENVLYLAWVGVNLVENKEIGFRTEVISCWFLAMLDAFVKFVYGNARK